MSGRQPPGSFGSHFRPPPDEEDESTVIEARPQSRVDTEAPPPVVTARGHARAPAPAPPPAPAAPQPHRPAAQRPAAPQPPQPQPPPQRPRTVTNTGSGVDAPGSALQLPAGTRIGHYEIIRELGRGGMGQVFVARDLKLGRKVAMKFLTAATPQQAQRFVAEARTTAQCSHENIVVIHDVSDHQGLPYMVLEFLDGQPLSRVLDGQPVPAGRAIELVVPVVRSLQRAHEFGIVHRDLKPENVFVTATGVVKVLDFGIAKLVSAGDQPVGRATGGGVPTGEAALRMTQEGALVGTLPYMSPEQWGMDKVDHRTDLWSLGIMMFEMVAGRHPLGEVNMGLLARAAATLDQPMPSVAEAVPDLPPALAEVIDRCLEKRKDRRFESAQALLDALTPLLPGRSGRALAKDESPFPGLTAFDEGDADRFFGRAREVASVVARLRDRPLVGIVGPSGVGKSSVVRAGVVPALKGSGEAWETFVLRPGRHPLESLASAVEGMSRTGRTGSVPVIETLRARLQKEPGYFGVVMRQHARARGSRILVFVDQFEELYTQVADAEERRTFTACLAALADDVAAPLRVVVSMRSDFLDRAAENPRFFDELTRGLVFLAPPDRQGLRDAIVQPAEMAGFRFEDPQIIDRMLGALEATEGALPLLQFAASRLWQARDRGRRMLTRAAYDAMGGVEGALATHAEQVLAGVAAGARPLLRAMMLRLVTPEGTRATVEVTELAGLSDDPKAVQSLIDLLVSSRLLVVQTRGDGESAAVEIVHESLIKSWPSLRRWLEQGREDAAFISQLRTAARQWEERKRPAGLLWRGEAADEARRYVRRARERMPDREQAYLDAVIALATRATRIRRIAIIGAFALLSGLVVAGAAALVSIRKAEQLAQQQAKVAAAEAARAQEAEHKVSDQLKELQDEQRRTKEAQEKERQAAKKAEQSNKELVVAHRSRQTAESRAERESRKAVQAEEAEKKVANEKKVLEKNEQDRQIEKKKHLSQIKTGELE